METRCHSLHRLKHKAVIALILVFSLLFYIFCMNIYCYWRTLEVIGVLENVDQEKQQIVLNHLFSGTIDVKDGKNILMKNGYYLSGQYFLFFDPFIIGISIGYCISMICLMHFYKNYLKKRVNKIQRELDYLKVETEHFLFGTEIIRDDRYKESNYLLDRLEQKINKMSLSNKNELNQIINFHQNIIHQINTPLSTIKILIEHLYDENKIEEKYLIEMNYAIRKASDLTNIYLRTSKLDTGKVRYSFEMIELYDIIEEVFNSLKIYAHYYKIILVNDCKNLTISADPVWIKEAIENIVKNFIENSRENNEIIVSSSIINDFNLIRIDSKNSMNGSIDDINFNRFESSKKGIGIGLHLCKQIVEAHLGEIIVKQNEIGRVSFFIYLPKQIHKKKIDWRIEDENNCGDAEY